MQRLWLLLACLTCTTTLAFASIPSSGRAATFPRRRHAPPSNTALPAISGQLVVGQTLTTTNGSWSTYVSAYTYQWQDCDVSGGNCTNITGATSSSYALTSGDVNRTIRSMVTATNSAGSESASSNATPEISAAAAPESRPVDTALPTISGTAQQGDTLTATPGNWDGTQPISYVYAWSDGAAGPTDALGASDVGQEVSVKVTATNSAGSASATSASVGPVASAATSGGGGSTGGLPPGVSLQQVDGGPNYYGGWTNSFPTSSSFYPIAVFNQTLGYNSNTGTWDPSQLAAYKAVGINGFINLYNGYNQALLTGIKNDGMWTIDGPLAPSYAGNTLTGYVWFDEADGNNRCGDIPSASVLGETVPCLPTSDGRTPASAIAQVTADLHKVDPTRFVYGQYTKPVARGEGLTNAQAAAYVDAVDVVSFDDYLITDGWESDHNLWEQYDLVQHVRQLGNYNKPVMPFIEAGEPFTSNQWSGITDTPEMSVAEAWNAIIGGARGIEWFDHDFGDASAGYANSSDDLIDTNSVFAGLQSAVKAFDGRVASLATVINSPFANGYVTTNGSMNAMAKYSSSDNQFYVFAAPRSTSSQNITFTVAGGYTGPVTVQGENRTVQATNGAFADTFANQTAVHIYEIPNNG